MKKDLINMIICAAVKLTMNNIAGTEMTICGHRHRECFIVVRSLNDCWKHAKQIQGFIDHKGRFLDRESAFRHAVECGQINAHDRKYREDNHIPNELYSEDLY